MDRRRIVERRDRPLPHDANGFVADGNRRRRGTDPIRRFVQRRAVEPHDALIAVVEFRCVREIEMVVCLDVVRRKVAVRDRVFVLVARFRLVDVLRGERRRKGEKRRDDEPGSGTGHRMIHVRIIRGWCRPVNSEAVSRVSQTGQ
jgi:hypothetical protein